MTRQDILTLFTYHDWANGEMLDAVAPLSAEQFLRDLGNSFPSVRDTVAHIFGADLIWLQRWRGEPTGALPAAANYPSAASLRDGYATLERDRRAYLDAVTEDRLAHPFSYKDTRGIPRSLVLAHSMQHVVNHASYHRGQITTMLRQMGAQPISTDLSRFYYERGAAATG
jgi:uncharacterized damage-inducible protein DinB